MLRHCLMAAVCLTLLLHLNASPFNLEVSSHTLSPISPFLQTKSLQGMISFDGARIYYEVRGNPNASETLFLIHGFMSERKIWNEMLINNRYLLKNYRIILINLRGKGRAEERSDPGDLKKLHYYKASIEDIHLILEKEQIERAIFIGHSMGGEISQYFAKTYPKKVKALVLVSTFSRFPLRSYKLIEIFEIDFLIRSLAQTILSSNLFVRVGERVKNAVGHVAKTTRLGNWIRIGSEQIAITKIDHDLFKERFLPPAFSAHFSAFLSGAVAMGSSTAHFNGQKITHPTLIIQGNFDRLVRQAEAHRLGNQIPNSKVHIIEGHRHLPHTNKKIFPTLINSFLESLTIDCAC